MKNQTKLFAWVITFALQATQAFAGLDWTNGALSNPDNLYRSATSIAYATNGNVFVAGVEENSTGSQLIVTKKYSTTGTILASVTNTYFVATGTIVEDWVKSITLDNTGNVYVLGSQYGGTNKGQDVVVIKYNSSLTLQWKKLINNTASGVTNYDDNPSKLLIDANNNVYVTGTWSQPGLFGTEAPFVIKYSTSGTLLFTENVPQAPGTTIEDVSDMCLDNSLNVTVCASTSSGTILYARINNTGSLSWKKFYSATAPYNFLGKPQIECTSGGTLYLSSSLDRESPSDNHFTRHMVSKLSAAGTKLWESLSPELNLWADGVTMRIDANNDVYTGSIFIAPHGGPYSNHRIYKFNTSGTLLWVHTSPETSDYLTFETFSSTALFVLTEISSPVAPVVRKLDAASGITTWSEIISVTPPPSYYHFRLPPRGIAVNSVTSEVAYCGNIEVSFLTPVYAEEDRWLVRKYGATSPRLTQGQTAIENTAAIDFKIKFYPNPATDHIHIICNNFLLDAIFVSSLR